MIYKDKGSFIDKENMPNHRGGLCINCKQDFWCHRGWQCFDTSSHDPWPIRNHNNTLPEYKFSNLPPDKRFLTQEMKDSISPASTGISKTVITLGGGDPMKVVNALRAKIDEIGVELHAKKNSVERAKDISDWRSWRHDRPGECDCGIARVDCTFHKDMR